MIVIIIPAKGDSSRLPNKNLSVLNGKPMLDYTVDQARASKRASAIFVSTDSDLVEKRARELGIEVIRRPSSLGGEVPIIDVYRHALETLGDPSISEIVGLQVDHPDRNISVDDAFAEYEKSGAALLNSTEADGTKNGAHYIMSRRFLDTGISKKTISIVDDCTNIHYESDLKLAEERLKRR